MVAVKDISDYFTAKTGESYLRNRLNGGETSKVFSNGLL